MYYKWLVRFGEPTIPWVHKHLYKYPERTEKPPRTHPFIVIPERIRDSLKSFYGVYVFLQNWRTVAWRERELTSRRLGHENAKRTDHFVLRYHPPSSTSSRWSALALLLLINTPINQTFSESLMVPDYCLFLSKNQNINAIWKWEAFCESGGHCKFKSRPTKNKRKKPIKIAFAS